MDRTHRRRAGAATHLALAFAMIAALLTGFIGAPQPAYANASSLFFSEYIEGSSFNKALEIYNGTGTTIDLSAYTVALYSNGAAAPSQSVALSGSLADGDVFVMAHPSADPAILAVADLISGSVVNYNGDDAVVLWRGGLGGTVVDAIGQVGVDPGSEWAGGGLDDTLRRLSTVCAGDTIPSDAFTFATEWEAFANNTFGGLGSHTANCAAGDAAPSVSTVAPANGASAVAVDSAISVTFSEAVTAASGAFSLSCNSAPVALAVSGGPTTFTLDPNADLPNGATCTLTVSAALITDQDATDPPDAMTADFSSSFTTVAAISACEQPFTPIYTIQGSGANAAITGNVTTLGVVVGDYEGANDVGIGGFYLQDLAGDGDPATSDGIFVFTGTAPGVNTVQVGDVVRVTGFARERFNETTINGSNSNSAAVPTANIVNCGVGSVAATPVNLPVADSAFLERYEGMLITLPQSLVISEYFNYDRFGEYVLALPLPGENRPYTPTALETPGSPGYFSRLDLNLRSRILIDDGLGSQNPTGGNIHPNGQPFSLSNSFRGGDIVTGFTGVLGFGFSSYRVQPTTYGVYTAVNPRPAAPTAVGGSLKVAAFNTLNYFLTLDYPSGALDNACGPLRNQECRGADSDQPDEFDRQRAKLLATLASLDADVIGLIELENTTGVEPMADIVASLPGYAFVETGAIGTDAIKVGIIYRTAAVQPVGNPAILDSQAFVNPFNAATDRNRPAVAQTFEEIATGARFTVVVNHLKSKGSGCGAGDDDLVNGQGNCNATRAAAVQALLNWLATDPTGSGDPDYLIVGDLNSYAKEDPIVALESAGYTNLIAQFGGAQAYSYVFDGQFGYLDYALASSSLTPQISGTTEWHINADEPDLIDYDTSFKSPLQDGYFAPDAFRSADHDPVIVGMNLDGAPPTTTAGVSGTIAANCPADCFFGSATVTLNAVDPSGVAGTWYRVNGGDFQPYSIPFVIATEGANLVEFYSRDGAGNIEATQEVTVKVTTFPASNLLDDYNRADGRLGANWSGATKLDQYRISANQVDVTKGGAVLWNTEYGVDQEAFVTLTALDSTSAHHTLLLKGRGVNATQGAILVSYDARNQRITVQALDPGYGWRTVSVFANITMAAGDTLGARAMADGSVKVYVNCLPVGTADTTTVVGNRYVNVGGRIGLFFHQAANAAFDNFGGGNRE